MLRHCRYFGATALLIFWLRHFGCTVAWLRLDVVPIDMGLAIRQFVAELLKLKGYLVKGVRCRLLPCTFVGGKGGAGIASL